MKDWIHMASTYHDPTDIDLAARAAEHDSFSKHLANDDCLEENLWFLVVLGKVIAISTTL